MALSRNTVIQPVNFNIPTLQLPMELVQAQVLDAQNQKDTYDALAQMMPKYVQEHSQDAQNYRNFVDEISKNVTSAFASGKSSQALRMLQEAKSAIGSEWKQGGLAYALQSYYDDLKAKQAKMEEKFKKDIEAGNNINYQLAQSRLRTGPLNYVRSTGDFDLARDPNIPTYFDVDKEIREWLKTIDPQEYGYSNIEGDWIRDVTGKKYHVREFASQFNKDPRVQQQLRLNAEFQGMNMSDEAKERYVGELNTARQGQYKSLQSNIEKMKQALSSGKKEEVEAVQALLSTGKYDVDGKVFGKADIDGKVGDRTKKALEMYEQEINSNAPTQYTKDDVVNLLYQEQLTGVSNKMRYAKPDSETFKLRDNPYALEQVKHRNRLKAQKEYADMWKELQQSTVLPATSAAIDVNILDKAVTSAKEAVDASKNNLNNVFLQNPDLFTTFSHPSGSSPSANAAAYRMALERNGYDVNKAAQEVGIPVAQMQQVLNIFKKPEFTSFGESAMNYAEAENSLAQANSTNNRIKKVWYESPENIGMVNKFIKDNKLDKKGITAEMIIYNPKEAIGRYSAKERYSADTQTYLLAFSEKNIVSYFIDKINKSINQDIKVNADKYKTAIPTGLRSNSVMHNMMEKNWTDYATFPDEFGGTEWSVLGSKEKEAEPKLTGDVKIQRQMALGKSGFTLVLTGRDSEGKIYEKRSYIGNQPVNQVAQNETAADLAEAIEKKNTTQALIAIEQLVPFNPIWSNLSPYSSSAVKGSYTSKDGEVLHHNNFQFTIAEKFRRVVVKDGKQYYDGEIAYVVLPSEDGTKEGKSYGVVLLREGQPGPDGKPQYHIQEMDDIDEDGKAIYPSSDAAKSQAVYNLAKEQQQRQFIGQVPARVRYDFVAPEPYQFGEN